MYKCCQLENCTEVEMMILNTQIGNTSTSVKYQPNTILYLLKKKSVRLDLLDELVETDSSHLIWHAYF